MVKPAWPSGCDEYILVLCHTYTDGLGGTGKLVCPWIALAGKPPVAPNGFPASLLTRQLRCDGALVRK